MKKSTTALFLLSMMSSAAIAQQAPLRILLVNDDGCHSPGIVGLQAKLTAKGYETWLVAPDHNQSSAGSSVTFKPGRIFNVQKVAEKTYCFPGTPSDAIDFGLTALLRNTPPDLVISGITDGPSTGAYQLHSGTMSAAVRALRFGYPALVVSIGLTIDPLKMSVGWPAPQKSWPDAIDYTVELVDTLNKKREGSGPIMPAGTGLSINYPPLAKEKIRGVKYIGNEAHPTPQIYYQIMPDGKAQQMLNGTELQPQSTDTDTGWLEKGWITYTLFDGQWNAPTQRYKKFQELLESRKLHHPQ